MINKNNMGRTKAEVASNKKGEKKRTRRNAIAIMAIMFATVAIWKGFSGLIDFLIISQSAALGFFVYLICIIIGLTILGLVHYHIRDLVK
jgi:sugar phosphate permease